MSAHITLTYSGQRSEREPLDLLLIEQQEWKPYTGVVTKGSMIKYLSALLYSESYEEQLDCGMSGGNVVCSVYVYPRVLGLAYQFHASHGTLSTRLQETVEITEACNFSLESAVAPKYPPLSIASATWADEVYDIVGNSITPPALTIASGEITTALAVYGAVDITYTTERHTYILTAPRRDEAVDNFYSAVVYGVYAGGLNFLEIEMPPGIEAFEADPGAICGGGGVDGSITDPDEDNPPPPPRPKDRKTVVDYCSQQVASDTYY